MAKVALLDVNVLVALFTEQHVHHELAHDWFADHRRGGWATCPVTQNGFVRVMTQLAAGDAAVRPAVVIDHLRRFCADTHHRFWPDEVSLTDAGICDGTFVRGHRQITDVYLLGLAVRHRGTLATFDAAIPLKAVPGATGRHVSVITA